MSLNVRLLHVFNKRLQEILKDHWHHYLAEGHGSLVQYSTVSSHCQRSHATLQTEAKQA